MFTSRELGREVVLPPRLRAVLCLLRSNDPTVFEHLVQVGVSSRSQLRAPQSKNKGKPGWDFLREGGDGWDEIQASLKAQAMTTTSSASIALSARWTQDRWPCTRGK